MERAIGRYRLEQMLGRGGGGEVWKAYDPELQRYVALKLIQESDEADRERFLREARAAAGLSHPNIVAVHEVGQSDGVSFIALDFVDGTTADAARLPARRAAEVIRDAARAAHHAHERGVIHRDLKPGNILVDRGGRVFVSDFGLARQVQSESRLTLSGTILGTPGYMPPEQARGEIGRVDQRSDVYSLGATLYALLTGREPFEGAGVYEIVRKVIEQDPVPPRKRNPRVHADLETIVLKAMDKVPALRYATAADLAYDLERYLDGEPIHARPPSVLQQIRRALRRRLAAVLPACLLLAAGAAWTAHALTRPGRIVVRVEPPDATVEIDGRRADGPEVPAGRHLVRVSAPDHESVLREVTVGRSETIEISARLRRESGFLAIEAEPAGTVVIVDAVTYGTPQPRLEISTGRHLLWAEAAGHFRRPVVVDIVRGETVRRRVSLNPAVVWSHNFADWPTNRVVGDVDGDGIPDVASNPYTLRAVAFSGRDGAVLVERQISEQLAQRMEWVDVDGDGVEEIVGPVSSQGMKTVAFSFRDGGKFLWTKSIPLRPQPGTTSDPYAPVVADLDGDGLPDLLVVGNDLHALRGRDGEVLWTRAWGDVVRVAVSAGDAKLLIVGDRETAMLSGRTGETLWTAEPDGGCEGTHGDLVFAAEDAIVYRSPKTGQVTRRVSPGLPAGGLGVSQWRLHAAENGRKELWDLAAGRRLWARRAEGNPWRLTHLDGDEIPDVLMTDGNRVEALRGGDGGELWSVALDRPAAREFLPLVSKGRLLLCAGSRAWCVDAAGGRIEWTLDLPAEVSCPPQICDFEGDGAEELFFGTAGGHVVAANWKGKEIFSALAVPPVRAIAFYDGNRDGLVDVLVHAAGPALVRSPKVIWKRTMANAIRAGARLHDVNDDGTPDVIVPVKVPVREFAVAAFDGRTGETLWEESGPYDLTNPVTLADVTSDGRPEVVVWASHGAFRALDARTGGTMFEVPVGKQGYDEIAAGDLDGDGVPDLVGTTWMEPFRIAAVSGRKRETLWVRPVVRGSWRGAALADPEAAGHLDVFLSTDGKTVHRFDGRTGEEIWSASTPAANWGGVTIVPGGQPLVVVNSNDGHLHALDARTGKPAWVLPGGGGTSARPLLVERGGAPALVIGTGRGLACISPERRVHWTFGTEPFTAPPVVADLDGDGRLEVLAGSYSPQGTFYCLDLQSGALLWQYAFGGTIEGAAAAADMDGDGVLDVIVTCHDRTVTVLSGRGRVR